jgi:hypothetical protein
VFLHYIPAGDFYSSCNKYQKKNAGYPERKNIPEVADKLGHHAGCVVSGRNIPENINCHSFQRKRIIGRIGKIGDQQNDIRNIKNDISYNAESPFSPETEWQIQQKNI